MVLSYADHRTTAALFSWLKAVCRTEGISVGDSENAGRGWARGGPRSQVLELGGEDREVGAWKTLWPQMTPVGSAAKGG